MPDSITPRATPAWRLKLAALWQWWTGELAAMVPERFPILGRGARIPVLALEDNEVVLVEPRSAAGPDARVALAALDEPRARLALRNLLERVGESRARARLCLAHGETLVRRVTMPAATEENLAQVVGFEMDRLTPFRADEVYHDQRVVARDAAAGQIVVLLAVARRDVVDARVARLAALGVSVQGVAVRDDLGPSGATLDLLPSEQRGERETPNERFVKRSLAFAVLALLAIALLMPAWQKREAVIALHPLLENARREAEATDVLARELERQVADYNFLLTRKHAPPALAFLEEFSRLLPDNTWVQQFDLRAAGKGREVQVTGETTSSSRLIEILQQSTLVQNAAPRGTVTRGSQPGTERFMIAAEARPRPLPETRPATEIAALPPPPPLVPPKAEVAAAPEAGAEEGGEATAAAAAEGAPEPAAKAPPVATVRPSTSRAPAGPPPAVPAEAIARRDAMRAQAKARNEARLRELQARRAQQEAQRAERARRAAEGKP